MPEGIYNALVKPRPIYYIFPNSGYRESLLCQGWYMKGAYAEKCVDGRWYMIRTVKKGPDHSLSRIQLKSDFWNEIQKKNKSNE